MEREDEATGFLSAAGGGGGGGGGGGARAGGDEQRSLLVNHAVAGPSEGDAGTDAPPDVPLPAGHTERTSKVNALLMSCSFCLIFTAFSSAQNFATSRKGDVGATAVGILYVVFMFGNVVSSSAVRVAGPKASLVLGAVTYVLFVAANIPFTAATMYPAGAVLGLGAALLWTAQGVYITRCAEYHEVALRLPAGSTMGLFNGIFWSVFQVSQFAGNLLVAVLFAKGVSTRTVFEITSVVAAAGAASLLLLRSMPSPGVKAGGAGGLNVTEMLVLFRERAVLLLTPVMIYSGLSQGFLFGQFPTLIDDRTWKFMTMAAFGAFDAAASMAMGKVSDRLGRYVVLCLGFACHLGAFLTLYFVSIPQHERAYFFVAAFFLGVGDGCYNTQLYAVLGAFYSDRSQAAFACFKFLASGTTAAAFFYAKHISDGAKLLILMGWIVAGHVGVTALHRTHASINRGTRVDAAQK